MTDAGSTCPLCPLTTDSETDVYRHLLISHRKHTLATALLEGNDRSRDPATTEVRARE